MSSRSCKVKLFQKQVRYARLMIQDAMEGRRSFGNGHIQVCYWSMRNRPLNHKNELNQLCINNFRILNQGLIETISKLHRDYESDLNTNLLSIPSVIRLEVNKDENPLS